MLIAKIKLEEIDSFFSSHKNNICIDIEKEDKTITLIINDLIIYLANGHIDIFKDELRKMISCVENAKA